MPARCYLFAFILLASFLTKAQDSLVYKGDLTFGSPFEKEAFALFTKGASSDLFDLFIANGSLLTENQISEARKRFYGYLESLKDEKFTTRKPDKKVKLIVNAIQSRYLIKYVAGSRFEDIFYNGNFSELSGTALYCLAFEHYQIPYEIKEDVGNVYVIAYPQTEKIMIESTTSAIIFSSFDENFKKQFVETLRKQKIISEPEFLKNNLNELFDTYYFNTKVTITSRGLVGLHYLTDGLTLVQHENYEAAFQHFEKAYYISESPKAAYLSMEGGSQAFLKHPQHDLKQAALLGKLSRYQALGLTDEIIAAEFHKAIQDLLFDKRDKETLEAYYQELLKFTHNYKTKREIAFVYNYENGRYLYNQARYRDAIPYLEETLNQKPNNQDAATIMISTLSQLASNQAQSEDYSKKLIGYGAKYPALSENNLFNSLLASSLLVQFAIKYEDGKPQEGESYRKNFEALYTQHPDLNLNSYLLGSAYSSAATYYFKKGQTKKAQEYLSNGLAISPDNYELKSRQRMIR